MATILCYGDSNTYGTAPMADLSDGRRLPKSARWPNVMGAALGPGHDIIAEGLPGRTTTHDDPVEGAHLNGLSVVLAVLKSHAPLDIVIVKLGTNDLKERFSVTALDIALSISRLVTAIKTSQTGPEGASPKVLVLCPPPIFETGELGEMFRGGRAKSLALGPTLARIAAREGFAIAAASALAQVSPLDGIHYAPETQIALGQALAAEISALLA